MDLFVLILCLIVYLNLLANAGIRKPSALESLTASVIMGTQAASSAREQYEAAKRQREMARSAFIASQAHVDVTVTNPTGERNG